MTLQDCIEFAGRNRMAWFATAEGSQPRVRALGLWFADKNGFYFQTGGMKDVYRQLKNNPRVEFAFYEPGDATGKMLRVCGTVEFLDDPELKRKVLIDRPFLRQFGLTEGSPDLIIFRLARGEAHFWSMETNLKPKEIIRFGFE